MGATVEIAISVASLGPGRIQAGDVVAVHPAGYGWGRAELARRLIVPAAGIILAEAWGLVEPLYAGGKRAADILEGDDMRILAKRRFRIPLGLLKTGWMPAMDLARARDVRDAYQPLLDAGLVVDFGEHVAICQDTYTGKYRFAKPRIA